MKKNVKKIFLLMAVVITAVVCLSFGASAATEGYYTYEVENGEATITDVDTLISGPVTIPSTLGGYPVTEIGDYVFFNCTRLTSITIPDSVTSIGNMAFYDCTSLKDAYASDVEAWLNISFSGYLSNPMCYAENLYFGNELVKDVVVPDSVTSIGNYAFLNCKSLVSITIGDSVTSIGNYAFENCTSLVSITIGDSVTSIGNYAFLNCKSLASINIPDGVTSIGSSAFENCTSLVSITIGDSVTSIGNYAFENCTSLVSITIGDSVTSIGNYAFLNCKSLASINIPDGVTSIGNSAFGGCIRLSSITIPDSVISIGDSAFQGCTNITTSITIGDSVTSIGNYVFYDCRNLTSVIIGDSVTSIGNSAFYNCISLADINIPDGVTSIGSSAFFNCRNLMSTTIPDSVTSIGASAFENCTSLTRITIPFVGGSATGNSYLGYIFGASSYSYNSTYVPASLKEIIISDKCTSIPSSAFYGCTSLTSITIPDSVALIDFNAFNSCTNLKIIYEGSESDWNKIYKDEPCHVHYLGCKALYTSTITKSPTCTATGTKTYTCSCGDAYSETIAKLGHSYSKSYTIDKKATCSAEGSKSKHCTRSGCTEKTSVTAISKLAHQYSSTCDTTCNVCFAKRSITHTYKTTTKKATLSKNGKQVSKCTECGEVKSSKTIYYPKSIKLSTSTYTYNGKVKTPTVVVKDSKGNTLKKDTDYTVKYAKGRKNPGKYTVTVTFKGKYEGTKKLTLTIKPKAPAISDIYSKTKGKAVIKWNNVAGESGYQLYYSTSKDGSYKKVTSYAADKTAGSKSKLKSGKTYYFKVRAYKKTSNGTVYSSWSAVKSVKVK